MVLFIESLPDGEAHTGRWLEEDLGAFLDTVPMGHAYHPVGSKQELMLLLSEVLAEARTGRFRPLLHIDAHGDEDRGGIVLAPSGEIVTWSELAVPLREINRATANNLNVVLACCFGFHGISAVNIRDVTPFLHLIGPEVVVTAGELQERMSAFYRTLFTTADLADAFRNLGEPFRIFYAEKLLAVSFIRYLAVGCRGRGKDERLERLLTELKAQRPGVNLRWARREMRRVLRIENADFEVFKRRFLLSGHPLNKGRFKITTQDCAAMATNIDGEVAKALRARQVRPHR